ncbi:MAG: hypothetical protein JNJ45_09205 [Chthonomonas sp.]|nr:hypothetical protein [Chthonomonas sp.]
MSEFAHESNSSKVDQRHLFDRFVRIPSNAYACESAISLLQGMSRFVLFSGPSGWGKSHLLRNLAQVLSERLGETVPIHRGESWILKPERADSPAPLLLEHVQIIGASPRVRQRLRLILERRIRGGKPTVLTHTQERGGRFLPLLLPGGSHWRQATLKTPTLAERVVMVHQMSLNSDLRLPPHLVSFVARRAGRTGTSISSALQRLQLVSPDWHEPHMALRAAGILGPILGEEGGWDVRDHIFESLQPPLSALATTAREEFAIYMMLEVHALSEDQVACYFGRTSGQVYRIAKKVAGKVASGEYAPLQRECSDRLLDSFFAS